MYGAPTLRAESRKSAGGKVYKIACSRNEWEAAFRLVYDAYVQSGLIAANDYEMRVTPFHLIPTTQVFVACRNESVVGTLSLVEDNRWGVPLESVYPQQVQQLRDDGFRFGEVTCLADSGTPSRCALTVVMKLMGLMAQFASRNGIQKLIIGVHPRHAGFYKRLAAFEAAGPTKAYPAVTNHPVIPMVLDLENVRWNNPQAYERFFGVDFPEEAFKTEVLEVSFRRQLSAIVKETYYDDADEIKDVWTQEPAVVLCA